jgi:ChpA-C
MRQVTRKGLATVAAAGGVLALGAGYAQADSGAHAGATGSPGALSGNNIQVPVHVPVNVCGNTVNVVGLLNPAMGNNCANTSAPAHTSGGYGGGPSVGGRGVSGNGGPQGGYGGSGGSGHDGSGHSGPSYSRPSHGGGMGGGSHSGGSSANSPGVGSGNSIGVPVDVPVNVCGVGASVIGLLNPVSGESCANPEPPAPPVVTPYQPTAPSTPHTPGGPRSAPKPPAPPKMQDVADMPPAPATAELAHTGTDGLGIMIPAAAGMLLAGSILYRRARRAAA